MSETLSWQNKNQRLLHLDPRTKTFMAIVISYVLIHCTYTGIMRWIGIILALSPFILSLLYGYAVTLFKVASVYVMVSLVPFLFSLAMPDIVNTIVLAFIASFAQLLPGLAMGYVLIRSTDVSEFIEAMNRLKVPTQIIIPFSLIFRLFPTISEEYKYIRSAMKNRGICGLRNPLVMLEYRLVPLLQVVLNIGNELTVSAMSRGMSSSQKRTSLCQIKLSIIDYILLIWHVLVLIIYALIS